MLGSLIEKFYTLEIKDRVLGGLSFVPDFFFDFLEALGISLALTPPALDHLLHFNTKVTPSLVLG